jgi:hypothetical protein
MEAAERIDEGLPIPANLEEIFVEGSPLGGARPKATVRDNALSADMQTTQADARRLLPTQRSKTSTCIGVTTTPLALNTRLATFAIMSATDRSSEVARQ